MHSYEPLPFSLLLVHRIYLPFKNSSVLSINGRDVFTDNYHTDSVYYFIEKWNEFGLESESGLISLKIHTTNLYEENPLQVLLCEKMGFVLLDSIRHVYLTPGIPTEEMSPKLTLTFTPY